MKTQYTWKYLESLIKKYYRTDENFVSSFEDDKRLGIPYSTFRQQKKRGSKKYLTVHIDYILEEFDKPIERLAAVFVEIFVELLENNLIGNYIEFKNNSYDFTIIKSWDVQSNTNICIKSKVFYFIEQLILNKFFRELFDNNKELLEIMEKVITSFLDKKIALLEYVKFIFKKEGMIIEIKFDKATISFDVSYKAVMTMFATLCSTEKDKQLVTQS